MTPSLDQADLIFLLDTPYFTSIYRIIKRFILQKLGIKEANYDPSFKMFWNMFTWNAHFEKKNKPEILRMLEPYEDKIKVLNNEYK